MMREDDRLVITEYCKALRLGAVAKSFESCLDDSPDCISYLKMLLQKQIDENDTAGIEKRIKAAKFPYRKYIEDLELPCLPEPLVKQLPKLLTLDFIREGKNVILTGNPGTGKTHTAIGLGIKACEAGYRVLFTTIPYLVTELKESNDKRKLRTYERRFGKYDLVIADELGYVSFDQEGADLLFNNLSQRVGLKSTIITSNLSFKDWDQVFGGPAITGAMVDRLTYGATLIDMTGDSYRLRETLRVNGLDSVYVMEGKKENEKRV